MVWHTNPYTSHQNAPHAQIYRIAPFLWTRKIHALDKPITENQNAGSLSKKLSPNQQGKR